MQQLYMTQDQPLISKEDKALFLDSHFSTVTKGGKAHQRIIQLHTVLAEADLGNGQVKIEYLRRV